MKSAQELAEEYLGKDFPEAFGSNAWMLSKHAYIVGYEAGRASLEEETAALREALEFYANPVNWSRMGAGAYVDFGKVARETLAEYARKEKE